jgi:ubiquinone biosynthesis protein COQ4
VEMEYPVEFAATHIRMIREIMDHDLVNELFAAERRKNPQLDAWFTARHVSTFTLDDLAQYEDGTLGGIYYRRLASMGATVELDLGVNMPTETDFQFWNVRGLQFHDLEHLLGGAGFNVVGEVMPATLRWGALFRHFSPELAGVLNTPTYLLNQGLMASAMLYTPEVYPILFNRMNQAWVIGQTSGPYFLERLEDYFHLPLPEARKALGINNVDDLDTAQMSEVMMDERDAA